MEEQQINQEMYQRFPYFNESNLIENDFRDDASRYHGWHGSRPYGWYGYGFPYGYGYGYPHWYGYHGWHRDDEGNQRHDYSSKHYIQPMPMPYPMAVQPIQPMPIQPIEKNYKEFKSLEQNVNITEINNTIINIEQKHPYMMKKLLLMGIAYAECKKIIYLALLCSGKFDL